MRQIPTEERRAKILAVMREAAAAGRQLTKLQLAGACGLKQHTLRQHLEQMRLDGLVKIGPPPFVRVTLAEEVAP